MDIVSNMLITVKNGGNAGKRVVVIPFSTFKMEIAKALFEEGYIASYKKLEKKNNAHELEIGVKFVKGKPHIKGIKRVSKPSRRIYSAAKNIQPVRDGFGRTFMSTPKGVLTGEQAREQLVGGEVLFQIW